MPHTSKLAAGSLFPSTSLPTVGGGVVDIAAVPGWRLFIVYRGKHCPLCKKYFKTLDGIYDELKSMGVTVLAVSADTKEKAEADVASEGWRFAVAYGLTPEQMRDLGLYISEPRGPPETAERPFAEPGLFVINSDNRLQIIDISNAPFSRPELSMILMGIKRGMETNYPIRGMMA